MGDHYRPGRRLILKALGLGALGLGATRVLPRQEPGSTPQSSNPEATVAPPLPPTQEASRPRVAQVARGGASASNQEPTPTPQPPISVARQTVIAQSGGGAARPRDAYDTRSHPERKPVNFQTPLFDRNGNLLVDRYELDIAMGKTIESFANSYIEKNKPPLISNINMRNQFISFLARSVRLVHGDKYQDILHDPQNNDGHISQTVKDTLLVDAKTPNIVINQQSPFFDTSRILADPSLSKQNPSGSQLVTLNLMLEEGCRQLAPLYEQRLASY